VAAPSGLNKQRRKAFLREASKQFQAQMFKRTASQNWVHSEEETKRFSAAMREAREQVPKEERWKLTKNHSHTEMAHAALVIYDVMSSMLPQFGKHPKRNGKSNKEVYGDISNTPVSAIVDSGANGVLITPATAKRKGLLDQIDSSHKVSINQANADQKFETFSILKGGVPYQMKSVHGRTLTITLPCHVAPVGSDLIGSNEQGPLIKGIGGIVYLKLSRPDGR
jgi:hypothetical protein